MSDQRYVSDELTNFVGASLPCDEDRYVLLIKILREDRFLVHPSHRDIALGGKEPHTVRSLSVDYGERFSSNKTFCGSYVCFCDIPVADLGIHSHKYGSFGIALGKQFLVRQGATPVFYVAETASMWSPTVLMGSWYDELQARLQRVWTLYPDHAEVELQGVLDGTLQELDEVFSYLKFFDPDKSIDDPEHFYMEREWRVLGCVRFSLTDVRRVILPEEYAERFRVDLPEYCNQLTFTPN